MTFSKKLQQLISSLLLGSSILFLAAVGLPTQAQSNESQPKTESPFPYRYEPISVVSSNTSSGKLNAASMFIAEQLVRNLDPEYSNRTIVITDFVALNTLNDTSDLGRLLAQNLMHEMQLRNWKVSDLTLRRNIKIEASGEFALSRDVKQLKITPQVGSTITGSYVNTSEGLILNVRMIELSSALVISSAQVKFEKDSFITQLLEGPPTPPEMKMLTLAN